MKLKRHKMSQLFNKIRIENLKMQLNKLSYFNVKLNYKEWTTQA